MIATEHVDKISTPDAENEFLAGLRSQSDPRLVEWARNYYFFSVHQARHLAFVIRALDPLDGSNLTEVVKAIFEEYGSGQASTVHSVLFGRFAVSAGVPRVRLSASRAGISDAVLAYVDEIENAYCCADIARVLGAYAYLERSAVLSYPIMSRTFRRLGFKDEDLEFFDVHVVQEAGHDEGATKMTVRYIDSSDRLVKFGEQIERMHALWTRFWATFG